MTKKMYKMYFENYILWLKWRQMIINILWSSYLVCSMYYKLTIFLQVTWHVYFSVNSQILTAYNNSLFSLSSFGYNILLLKKKISDSLVLQTCKCSINKSLIDHDDKLVSGLFTLSSCSPGSVYPESVRHYYSSPYTLFTPYRYPCQLWS